jgi:hypothetical protein
LQSWLGCFSGHLETPFTNLSITYAIPSDPKPPLLFSAFLCLITQELHRNTEHRQHSYRPIEA